MMPNWGYSSAPWASSSRTARVVALLKPSVIVKSASSSPAREKWLSGLASKTR